MSRKTDPKSQDFWLWLEEEGRLPTSSAANTQPDEPPTYTTTENGIKITQHSTGDAVNKDKANSDGPTDTTEGSDRREPRVRTSCIRGRGSMKHHDRFSLHRGRPIDPYNPYGFPWFSYGFGSSKHSTAADDEFPFPMDASFGFHGPPPPPPPYNPHGPSDDLPHHGGPFEPPEPPFAPGGHHGPSHPPPPPPPIPFHSRHEGGPLPHSVAPHTGHAHHEHPPRHREHASPPSSPPIEHRRHSHYGSRGGFWASRGRGSKTSRGHAEHGPRGGVHGFGGHHHGHWSGPWPHGFPKEKWTKMGISPWDYRHHDLPKETAETDNDTGPSISLIQTSSTYILSVAVPGVKIGDVAVAFDEASNEVVVSGKRPAPRNGHALIQEHGSGPFARRVRLSEEVKDKAMTAHLESGMLEIEVPLARPEATAAAATVQVPIREKGKERVSATDTDE